jgi:hypothetical protein
MAPPQKRKRHADTAKVASENSQAPKLVPNQVIVVPKTVKATTNRVLPTKSLVTTKAISNSY